MEKNEPIEQMDEGEKVWNLEGFKNGIKRIQDIFPRFFYAKEKEHFEFEKDYKKYTLDKIFTGGARYESVRPLHMSYSNSADSIGKKSRQSNLFLLTKKAMSAINTASNEPLDIVKYVAIDVPRRQTTSMVLRYQLVSSLNWFSDKSIANIVTKPIRSMFIICENPSLVPIGFFNMM